jgi:hypothetical protein
LMSASLSGSNCISFSSLIHFLETYFGSDVAEALSTNT